MDIHVQRIVVSVRDFYGFLLFIAFGSLYQTGKHTYTVINMYHIIPRFKTRKVLYGKLFTFFNGTLQKNPVNALKKLVVCVKTLLAVMVCKTFMQRYFFVFYKRMRTSQALKNTFQPFCLFAVFTQNKNPVPHFFTLVDVVDKQLKILVKYRLWRCVVYNVRYFLKNRILCYYRNGIRNLPKGFNKRPHQGILGYFIQQEMRTLKLWCDRHLCALFQGQLGILIKNPDTFYFVTKKTDSKRPVL